MRILVASCFEAGSLKAHAINTVKMAQGFARLGHDVTVVCRSPSGSVSPPATELKQIYGLTSELAWRLVRGRILRWHVNEHQGFGRQVVAVARRFSPDFAYTRAYDAPVRLARMGIHTAVETHAHIGSRDAHFHRMLAASNLPQFRGIITISKTLASHYAALGAVADKIGVFPDAVDLEQFRPPSQLPDSPFDATRPNIVYCGHLYEYKGIPTVLEAAALLPHCHFHIVGGLPADVARERHRAHALRAENVTFHGLQRQCNVPRYLWHADILLLPPSARHPSARWTSPVKLGEYLAAQRPVLSSDIPALRDWLTPRETEFVKPDDAIALRDGIERLLSNPSRRQELVTRGRELATRLSYACRAESVMSHCKVLHTQPVRGQKSDATASHDAA